MSKFKLNIVPAIRRNNSDLESPTRVTSPLELDRFYAQCRHFERKLDELESRISGPFVDVSHLRKDLGSTLSEVELSIQRRKQFRDAAQKGDLNQVKEMVQSDIPILDQIAGFFEAQYNNQQQIVDYLRTMDWYHHR
jgi:hypothetical protein